jgi:DNA-binding transcriptional MerR regulator
MRRFFIGQLATEVGLTPKTIRYYETVGLLPPPARTESRYRLYTPQTAELLRFIQKAKALGFTLTEIREIMALRQRGHLPCPHVHALLTDRTESLSRQIQELSLLRDELRRLAKRSASLPRTPKSPVTICPHIERAQIETPPLASRRRQKSP